MTTTSNIGLGSLSTSSSGSTTLGTTLFGVDIDTLVNNLVEAKSLPNTLRQVRIDANTTKLSAYADLESKLSTLRTAAAALRNPKVTSGTSDVFDAKQTLSRASGSVDASSLFGVSAASNAATGSYSLTVNRIAKADTISGTVAITDTTTATPLAADGILTIEGQDINLTSMMTLSDIKDAINTYSGTTKINASIVQAGTNDYRLVLKGTQTGNAISIADDQTGDLLSDLGLAASGATDTSLSAELVLDGVTAIRSTNSINDLITGLSIELYQADPGKPATLTVDNNLSGISDAVASLISAYNDVVSFVKTQRAVGSDGSVSAEQVLFNDSLMQSTYRNLQSIIAAGASGLVSGSLQGLGDIGIELGQDGTLSVTNETKFEDALLQNLEGVRALFGFTDTATTGFVVVDRPDAVSSNLIGKAITINVTATDASGVPTAAEFVVDGVTTAATISGGFIKGMSGTEFEGFSIGYTGGVVSGTPFTGTFTPTQGIADQIAGSLESVLDGDNGDLKAAKDQLTTANTRMEAQNTALTNQLDLYRARLTTQFQAAQEVIAALESQKNSLSSYIDSLNGKSG